MDIILRKKIMNRNEVNSLIGTDHTVIPLLSPCKDIHKFSSTFDFLQTVLSFSKYDLWGKY